ncbi:MAG: cytochrome c biogenesis protein ResB [Candidatus Omnitrophica bacterium]|nr:cytochrome c biogenesis protein ResB [Candidatus Omnitrophota bacterium]
MNIMKSPLRRFLGSLQIAVALLIAIAVVLAWGTLYETRFGTAAVQRAVYQAWWFQAILGFLAINLAVAAFERYPWKRKHLPFVLAHLGIILILLGGIIGGRFGIEGQLIIPEGQAERMLQLPTNVLSVHHHASETTHVAAVDFETHAWVHELNRQFVIPLEARTLHLTVDRYFPDAQLAEEITGEGTEQFPAAQVRLTDQSQEDSMWLLANDPERFGVGWGAAHLLFFAPETKAQRDQLLGKPQVVTHPRGVVSVKLPNDSHNHDVPVPAQLGQAVAIAGTPYTIMFKDYFADFALGEQGPVSRSQQPNNPAVAFTLNGPEGTDAHLLFALHPNFAAIHGRSHVINAEVAYRHDATAALPPNTIALIAPSNELMAVATDEQMQRTVFETIEIGRAYTHPSLGYTFSIEAYHPKAKVTQHITNRSDDVRAEAIHVIGRLDDEMAESWVWLRQPAELRLGNESVVVEYRPGTRELPVTIKLSDFRKIDYPGTQMAAGFEADVQLTDAKRGVILMRKISMNNPLRYRGYSFFQSSYVPGEVETTVLSVRNDPGTPLVYAGFLIVVGGIVSLFLGRRKTRGRRR